MRLLRWSERVYQYDFHVVYKPGNENLVVDMLSRLPAREFESNEYNSESEPTTHTEPSETSADLGASVRTGTTIHSKQAFLDLESEDESF